MTLLWGQTVTGLTLKILHEVNPGIISAIEKECGAEMARQS